MKLYKDGQLVGEFSTTELKELAGVDIEKAAEAVEESLAEATTEFKVGDTVKVVGSSAYQSQGKYIGGKGNVTKIWGDGDVSVKQEDGYKAVYPPSSLELIKEEPEEVLSYENVKVGEYFVITDNTNYHGFEIADVIKVTEHYSPVAFKADKIDGSANWNVRYTDVRRATDAEIAEATNPKEVKFDIGDAISVNGRFAFILCELDSEQEYKIQWYSDGEQTYADKSYIRHATEEEKSHLQTLIGREKDEYKVGDLVELLDGFGGGYRGRAGYIFEVDSVDGSSMPIHLKDNGNKTATNSNTWSRVADLKLITPVEWRHDFVEEVK
ncbi:hypothetical protein EHX26_00305 [Brochothrix thermosphacta]|uniref:hypothetical protein n=1 Tax=Brochothrix thermosphacta TaxID=2756 RepID=UPI00083F629E|nr:hypothetical protein [Brochothrix thermosphacta]MPQ27555.1 hypothetical protein [Brochothrix thermosphacta]ODJ55826.1 hypothetical protein BFR38_07545 [Brochothrix thermosphacta]